LWQLFSPTFIATRIIMAVAIREVRSSRDLRRFITFPFSLYKDSPYWIPPLLFDERNTLDPKKNPAFDHCSARLWLAEADGRVVGRIAGIINRESNRIWARQAVRFGWFDFIDDHAVVEQLLKTVEAWAREEGMNEVHGPLGFSDMDREGMLVEGFEELSTMATQYNHAYYPAHMDRCGYVKDVDWLEYNITVPPVIPEKALRVAALAAERKGLHILPARKAKDLLPYAHQIFEIINDTYGGLYGFVPLSEREIEYYVKMYFPNISPHYTKLLIDSNGRLAAFVIGMPSLSHALQKARGRLFPFGVLHLLRAMRRPKTIDLYLGAVRRDLQGKGADAFLITALAESCIQQGIVSAESNLELEDNKLVQAHWKNFERRQHKRRRCYRRSLV
jgi:hypothetical protein